MKSVDLFQAVYGENGGALFAWKKVAKKHNAICNLNFCNMHLVNLYLGNLNYAEMHLSQFCLKKGLFVSAKTNTRTM
jgi:hypothetical protein